MKEVVWMKRVSRCVIAVPLLVGAGACIAQDEHVADSAHESTVANGMSLNGMSLNGMSLNGMSLNGMSLNGMSLNGMSLNGMSLNGMSLNGMSLNGMSLNGMSLNGTELTGVATSGQVVSGTALVGAELNGVVSNGASLPMRVDAAATLPAPNDDVWAYEVSYRLDDGVWRPLCGTTAGQPVLAVPLAGTWDYGVGPTGGAWTASTSSFTLACRGTAISKCVELGYKPWSTVGGVSLRDHHQTCTRVLRADYCGNGQPGTLNGWQINLHDPIGVQADTENGPTWVFEAEWSASGALCVDEYRVLELVVGGDVPTCALEKLSDSCGEGTFSAGALMRSESNATGLSGLVAQLLSQNPGTPLADRVEDALASLENGFAELALTPPARDEAVGYFASASGDLEAAIDDDLLDASYGRGLLNRIAGVARHQAKSAIVANQCSPAQGGQLTAAWSLLIQADVFRAAGRFEDACAKYGLAVVQAEDAGGSPCAP
jgi:hypothetical protein